MATFVMAAASLSQIVFFLFRLGGTPARSIGRALALGKPRVALGAIGYGGEAKKLPPYYGTSVAPAARLRTRV